MAVAYTRTKEPVCTSDLVAELNAALSVECIHIVINDGDQVSMIFASELDAAGIEEMEDILVNHVCTHADGGGNGGPVEDPNDPDSVRDDMVGGLYQFNFVDESGSTANKWVSYCGDGGNYSNKSPAIIPWKSRLVGMTFTNERNNIDVRLDVYTDKNADSYGYANHRALSWLLQNTRSARNTNITEDIILEAGEKVAVFAMDYGDNPKRTVITLYFQIMEDNNDDVSENSQGYIHTS